MTSCVCIMIQRTSSTSLTYTQVILNLIYLIESDSVALLLEGQIPLYRALFKYLVCFSLTSFDAFHQTTELGITITQVGICNWNAPLCRNFDSEGQRNLTNPDCEIQDGFHLNQQVMKAVRWLV